MKHTWTVIWYGTLGIQKFQISYSIWTFRKPEVPKLNSSVIYCDISFWHFDFCTLSCTCFTPLVLCIAALRIITSRIAKDTLFKFLQNCAAHWLTFCAKNVKSFISRAKTPVHAKCLERKVLKVKDRNCSNHKFCHKNCNITHNYTAW